MEASSTAPSKASKEQTADDGEDWRAFVSCLFSDTARPAALKQAGMQDHAPARDHAERSTAAVAADAADDNEGVGGRQEQDCESPSLSPSPPPQAMAGNRQFKVLIRDGKPVIMHRANPTLTTEQRLQILMAVKVCVCGVCASSFSLSPKWPAGFEMTPSVLKPLSSCLVPGQSADPG